MKTEELRHIVLDLAEAVREDLETIHVELVLLKLQLEGLKKK